MKPKPNILLLVVDQLKASAIRPFNPRGAPCPFWERMAARGVTFSETYAVSPVCAPSRAALHTGVYPLVNDVTCNQHKLPVNLKQLPEFLMEAGYYTCTAGHYERKNNLCRGYHEQQPSEAHGPVKEAYERWRQCGREAWSSGPIECEAEQGHGHLLADRAIHMMDAAVEADLPFFMQVCFEETHPPYFVPRPYHDLVDPASVRVPDINASDEGRPRWQLEYLAETGARAATAADIQRMIATYHGQAAYADAQMAGIHAALEARGLHDDTWIILTSDHGDFGGEKGLFTKAEVPYECLLHVPLVIVPPTSVQAPRGLRVSSFVELIDLFPSILRMARVTPPSYAQGLDLTRWIEADAVPAEREHVFAAVGNYHGFLKNTLPAGVANCARRRCLVRGIRSRRYLFVSDPEYGDEAYDLESDPGELHNLLNEVGSSLPRELAGLNDRLNHWAEECRRLKSSLGVKPGARGFIRGWE